ncbi:ATP-dependent DNA helicase [Trichonephila clavipes]|nr:ATP-dependent DNA helicase [Trichonephila clavipes]
MQPVYFFDDEERQALERAAQRNTMLTAWFELNRTDPDANKYIYADIPKHFVWKNNKWETRVRLGDRIESRRKQTTRSVKEACCAKNLLEDDVRGLGEIAVPVTWTGISAVILEGGRTAHSKFNLPVPILDNS